MRIPPKTKYFRNEHVRIIQKLAYDAAQWQEIKSATAATTISNSSNIIFASCEIWFFTVVKKESADGSAFSIWQIQHKKLFLRQDHQLLHSKSSWLLVKKLTFHVIVIEKTDAGVACSFVFLGHFQTDECEVADFCL